MGLVVLVALGDLCFQTLPVGGAGLLPAHFPPGSEDVQRLVFDSAVFNVQNVLVNVGLVPAAHRLHERDVRVLGFWQWGEVVRLRGGFQHGLGFGHLVPFEDLHVGLEEADEFFALDLVPRDLLDDYVFRGEEERDEELQVFDELFLNVFHFPVKVGIRCDPETGVREEKALDLREAGPDVLSEVLELGVLFVGELQPLVHDLVSALLSPTGFVRVAPVAHQELQLLKGRLPGVFQRESAVGGEQLQMLEVVFLDVGGEIVNEDAADHGREGEDRGAVPDRARAVEGSLSVHKYDGDLLSGGGFHGEDFGPHEDPGGVSLGAPAPVESL